MGAVPAAEPARAKLLGQQIIVLGLLVLMFSLPRTWAKMETRRWPTIEATVVFSDVVERTGKTHDWCVRVAYRYAVGAGRQGGVRRLACSASRAGAEAKLAQWQPGQRIEAHYDPAHPERSVVEHESPGMSDVLFGALALTLFAVGFDRIRRALRLGAAA